MDKAAMLRLLEAAGASRISLALAFGVSETTVRRVLAGEVWFGIQCLGCYRMKPNSTPTDYCEVCRPQICTQCGRLKSPGRSSPTCVECDRAAWSKSRMRKGVCRECGEPLPETRRDMVCSECRRDSHQLQKRARSNTGKLCSNPGCERPLPMAKSWSRSLCHLCAREHDRRRRALSRRKCRVCEAVLGEENREARCPRCQQIRRKQLRLERYMEQSVTWEEAIAMAGVKVDEAAVRIRKARRAGAAAIRIREGGDS